MYSNVSLTLVVGYIVGPGGGSVCPVIIARGTEVACTHCRGQTRSSMSENFSWLLTIETWHGFRTGNHMYDEG